MEPQPPPQDIPPFLSEQKPGSETKKKDDPAGNFQALASKVNDTEARLRVLEERYGNIRKKTQLTDQNMLDFEKEFSREMKMVLESLTDLKRTMSTTEEKLQQIQSELSRTATKYEVQTLERYLDLWQPMQFVQKQQTPQTKE